VAKPKVALYWAASCGGCEEAVVDLAERVLDLVGLVDIVFWPVALDFKLSDLEAMEDKSIDVALINGGIRTTENERIVKTLRAKAKYVVAYGACSSWGGVPGLANLSTREEILDWVYSKAPTNANAENVRPTGAIQEGVKLELPTLLAQLEPLDRVIDVDYYVPGCPPTANVTWKALQAIVSGNLPARGSVIGADNRALCYSCPLNDSKPEKVLIKEFKRVTEFAPDLTKCLLTQGVPCLGPVTRGGCEALCVKGGMPCTGCFGPLDGVNDFGGKAVTYLASVLDLEDEKDIEAAFSKLVDVVGLSYKYSLPASALRGRLAKEAVVR
jgi:F420-non-reducing hydrogenase small subunit